MSTRTHTLDANPPISTELDERQRAKLHAASHRTLRVTMLALLAGMAFLSFHTDDLVPQLALGFVVFATMAAHWWYQRREGVDKELEAMQYARLAREPLLGADNVRMFVWFTLIWLGGQYADGALDWRSVPRVLAMAALTTVIAGWALRALARRELRRAASGEVDPAYTRGRRLGAWIAKTFRRS